MLSLYVSLLDRLDFKSEILLIHPEKPRSESLSATFSSKEPISSPFAATAAGSVRCKLPFENHRSDDEL